jgi:hypothetical protein
MSIFQRIPISNVPILFLSFQKKKYQSYTRQRKIVMKW